MSCGCRAASPIDLSKVIDTIRSIPGVVSVTRTAECNADLQLVVDTRTFLLKIRPGKPSCNNVIRVMPSSDYALYVKRLVNEARR